MVKNPPANGEDATDVVSIPGLGKSPGEGKGYPLQDSGLENPMNCMERNPSKMVCTERGHQRADRLKLQSQTTSQSDHTDHSLS